MASVHLSRLCKLLGISDNTLTILYNNDPTMKDIYEIIFADIEGLYMSFYSNTVKGLKKSKKLTMEGISPRMFSFPVAIMH